ncbi:MAG TPA: SDR family oxidoreductase [Acidimicrobiales bacterium]|nr:SDR family oxidoreductase [Acidimicrobiales bacterium]
MTADRLAGRRIVVVGGTSGMGRATARAAAARGAEVVAAGRRPVAERAPLDGVREMVVDVVDEASVRDLFTQVGELDHLLVTATAGSPGPFLDQDLAAARTFMDGKFFGSWSCARHAAPRLRPGGSITFVTGGAVVRPPKHGSMIVAAFAALEALTRALAIELGPLRVNTLRPGYTDSEMWSFLAAGERDQLRGRVAAALPAGRMGTPDDIADAALFLMANPQVTGTVLEVSGGETLVNTLEAQR